MSSSNLPSFLSLPFPEVDASGIVPDDVDVGTGVGVVPLEAAVVEAVGDTDEVADVLFPEVVVVEATATGGTDVVTVEPFPEVVEVTATGGTTVVDTDVVETVVADVPFPEVVVAVGATIVAEGKVDVLVEDATTDVPLAEVPLLGAAFNVGTPTVKLNGPLVILTP